MVNVFAWPPIWALATNWTMELPTSRSNSLLSGREYVSAAQRRRRLAGFEIHARAGNGAGYMEALWRMMDGGTHLVRLTSCQIAWGKVDVASDQRTEQQLEWETPAAPLGWTVPPADIVWFAPVKLPSVFSVERGVPTLRVSNLPGNSMVAIPGEFLTIFDDAGLEETIMIANAARSNAAGVAVIRLVSTPTLAGPVSIGTRETGVFRLQSNWPRAMRRATPDNYALEFREVFEDETDGFRELNPWI